MTELSYQSPRVRPGADQGFLGALLQRVFLPFLHGKGRRFFWGGLSGFPPPCGERCLPSGAIPPKEGVKPFFGWILASEGRRDTFGARLPFSTS
jgi:hypothetical protein